MLNDIKKMLGITNTEFDTIIQNYIDAGVRDLAMVGVKNPSVNDKLIYSAVMSYVMSYLDSTNGELYANAYALQKDSLRHYVEYNQ